MIMSEAQESRTVMLGSREFTAMVLGAILLIGLVACIGYIAGRSITTAQYLEEEATFKPDLKNAIVVDPVKEQAPPAPAPAPAVAPVAAQPQVFLQVGALDEPTSREFLLDLSRQGFQSRIVPGPDSKTFRVLVGPLSRTEIHSTQAALTQAGYTSFVKIL
jgi:cell division protein FtsN